MAELDMAQRIKDLRVSQNLTLEQVANEVGVGKKHGQKMGNRYDCQYAPG